MLAACLKINSGTNVRLYTSAGYAFLDQSMLSAVNFIVSIILIKNVPKYEYGYYAIIIAVILFLVSMQNALVTTPLAVLITTKGRKERTKYCNSLFWGQVLALVPVVSLGLVIVWFLSAHGVDDKKLRLIWALLLSIIGILCREFVRSYHFALEDPKKVLRLDFLYSLSQLSLVLICLGFLGMSVQYVLFIMGISSIFIVFTFIGQAKFDFRKTAIRGSYRENWQYGKWALAGVLVTHLQSYSYLYFLGAFLSSMAVAEVSAARLLLMPLVLFQAAWGKVVIPHGARMRDANRYTEFFNQLIISSVIFSLLIIVYIYLLFLASSSIGSLVFTEEYAEAFDLVIPWGVVYISGFISLNANLGLQVLREFSVIAKINFVTMLITVFLSVFLIKEFGVYGGLAALGIGNLFLGLFLWLSFRMKLMELI